MWLIAPAVCLMLSRHHNTSFYLHWLVDSRGSQNVQEQCWHIAIFVKLSFCKVRTLVLYCYAHLCSISMNFSRNQLCASSLKPLLSEHQYNEERLDIYFAYKYPNLPLILRDDDQPAGVWPGLMWFLITQVYVLCFFAVMYRIIVKLAVIHWGNYSKQLKPLFSHVGINAVIASWKEDVSFGLRLQLCCSAFMSVKHDTV